MRFSQRGRDVPDDYDPPFWSDCRSSVPLNKRRTSHAPKQDIKKKKKKTYHESDQRGNQTGRSTAAVPLPAIFKQLNVLNVSYNVERNRHIIRKCFIS